MDPSGHWCEKKEDIYRDLVEKNGLDINNIDPDTRQRLMAEAANEARGRRKAANSNENHVARLPGPVLPEQNEPSRPGADMPDDGGRGNGGEEANIQNKRQTPDQKALRDLAKEAEKLAKKGNPISEDEAKILDDWADEYNVPQHHKAYPGSGKHFKGGNYLDHTHIYNIHVPYKSGGKSSE